MGSPNARVILLAGVAFVALVACSRQQSPKSSQQSVVNTAPQSVLHPVSPGPGLTPTSRTQTPPQPVLTQLSGNDRLLALSTGMNIEPSDYDIGPLETLPSGDEASVAALIGRFLDSMVKSAVDESTVLSDQREYLDHRLSGPIAAKTLPDRYRIGLISVEGDRARAKVRLESEEGRADGTVYCVRDGGSWFVENIEADFAALAETYHRESPYEPSNWQWTAIQ